MTPFKPEKYQKNTRLRLVFLLDIFPIEMRHSSFFHSTETLKQRSTR